jgi:mono/diheme cytochrome c family protein
MKKVMLIISMAAGLYACSDTNANRKEPSAAAETSTATEPGAPAETSTAESDPKRGVGKFTKVEVSPRLDKAMADAGKKIVDIKCSACHKLTDEKLVGPGWKGVTTRRTPEWILNFITNTDEMLQKDAQAQALLEVCLVRMPNQNLTDADARNVYEFMRKNDGVR